MKTFKSVTDVEAAGLSPPVQSVVHGVVSGFIAALAKYGAIYDPEDDGYTILIEGGDEEQVAAEIGYPRTHDREGSIVKLEALVAVGVTTFIDLTTDADGLASYAELLNEVSDGKAPLGVNSDTSMLRYFYTTSNALGSTYEARNDLGMFLDEILQTSRDELVSLRLARSCAAFDHVR